VDRTVNVGGQSQPNWDAPADRRDDAPYTELLDEANRLLETSPARPGVASVSPVLVTTLASDAISGLPQ
jgi:hypothetical protein